MQQEMTRLRPESYLPKSDIQETQHHIATDPGLRRQAGAVRSPDGFGRRLHQNPPDTVRLL